MKYFSILVASLLFGCSSIRQIQHIQGHGLTINDNIYISEEFSREIWNEMCRITGFSGPMPEIRFTLHSPTFPVKIDPHGGMTTYSHYGTYSHGDGIAYVYFGDSISVFNNPKETQAFMYGVLAHEFMHRIYIMMGKDRKLLSDHCRMISSGDQKKIWKFIASHEETDGSAEEYETSITEKACRGQ